MEAEYNATQHVKNLPDIYKKTKNSNNYKILEIEADACNELRNTLQSVDSILDINNAKGETLDLYGERVGQERGQADDAKYLIMIKSKIMRNLSNGTHPSMLKALCLTLGCDPSDIKIEDGEAPCTVKINALPLAKINRTGFTVGQITAIIKSLLPVCIGVEELSYEGTFEFSDSENEYDENAGFCDVEGGTIGGHLGALASDKTEVILPI